MKEDLFSLIIKQSKELKILESIMNVLVWDQETMLPHAGAVHRGDQKALLAGLIHEKKIDNSFFAHIETAYESLGQDCSDKAIIIKRLRRDIHKARKLTTSFVERFTQATSQAFFAWEEAKVKSSWKHFQPHLETLVGLAREKADLLGFSEHPYDALLDEYEPEMTTKEVASLFSALKPQLQTLLEKIKKTPFHQAKKPSIVSSTQDQLNMSHELLSFVGFDWNRGRLDTTSHPFSIAFHPNDSRITIRKDSDDTLDQLLSALHEAGHSFYEMGLDQSQYGTPLAETVSLGIHESQSRFWETIIGRSRQFCPHLFSLLKKYNHLPPSISPDDLYISLNQVAPSYIRTQADEVTYPFHVFLRFDIERELLEGSLRVCDIPEAWNSGMKATLGIEPPSHREGCLQDVHWSVGMFGYFSSYVLGSMYAANLWSALKKDLPQAPLLIQEGTFGPFHEWLKEAVWMQGRRYSSKKLVEKALGEPPSADHYMSYLNNKYDIK